MEWFVGLFSLRGQGRSTGRELFLWAAVIPALFGIFSSAAQCQPNARKVIRGSEILVSIAPKQAARAARAQRPSAGLHLPRSVRVSQTLADGSLGVLSASAGAAAMSEDIIDADEPRIRRLCSAIQRQNKSVLRCEPNFLVEAAAVPNDQLYPQLWGLQSISAPRAWDISTGSPSVVVAVIDTGIDYRHPELAANIAMNPREVPGNGIDDDANGVTDDFYGYDFRSMDPDPIDDHSHGTLCAGTIAARGNNSRGVAGVAWNIKVLPIKVLNSAGNGTYAHVTAGISYAVRRGARLINLSLGGTAYSQILEDAVLAARDRGVLIVAAAGNSAVNSEVYPYYPASLGTSNIISVAALTADDALTFFSNWGPNSVDLGAPGEDILSTTLGGQYELSSGTSMASPHVAGIAALMLSANPSLSAAQLKAIILQSVDPLPDLDGLTVSGGRANAHAAVSAAQGFVPIATPLPTRRASPTVPARSTWRPGATPTSTPIPSRPIMGSTATPIPATTPIPLPTARATVTFQPTLRPTMGPTWIPTARPPITPSPTPTLIPTVPATQTAFIPSRPLPTFIPTTPPTVAPTSPMPESPPITPTWSDTEALTIFMTSRSYSANLGGIEGARQKCQSHADAVPALAGTRWFPLLSDGTFSAISLTGTSLASSPIYNMDGSIIAPNRAALWNTRLIPLLGGIHNTETGERVHDHAFTGTDATGRATPHHCGNWGSQFGSASLGVTNSRSAFWITGNQSSCSNRYRLICIGARGAQ